MYQISSVSPKFQATIPLAIRKAMGLKTGDKLLFRQNGDKIEIEKMQVLLTQDEAPKYSLNELLADFEPETLHNYIDSGNDVGKENTEW